MNTVINEKDSKVKNAKKGKIASTQSHLRISEIRNDTVILKNGGSRAVIETTSINFNLKSEDEQNAIIQAYQSFLNILDFPVQIMVRSKKLDLDNYLNDLSLIADKQTNPLLQKQTYDYVDYIKKLLEYADIMKKSFYVVVPYNALAGDDKPSGIIAFFQKFLNRIRNKQTDADFVKQKKQFDTLKKGLDHRVNVVSAALENCGVKVNKLNTQELIELYYNSYNPDLARLQKVSDINSTDILPD
jgi:hypothetical protein